MHSIGRAHPAAWSRIAARLVHGDERVQQGQLDECGLTLQELAKIREAFIPVLTAIFHVRAPYPVDPTRRAKSDAELRREST